MESNPIENDLNECTHSENCSQFIDARVGNCNTSTGICHCILSSCFVYNNQTNHCDLRKCHAVEGFSDSGKIVCVNSGGKSKRLALFLNLISFTGAVNFYLGNNGQAVIQLLLFIVSAMLCCFSGVKCLYDCRRSCKDNKQKNLWLLLAAWRLNKDSLIDDDASSLDSDDTKITCKSATLYLLWSLCSCSFLDFFAAVLSAVEFVWMIAEFINIGINGKLDGNGCFLDDDTFNHIRDVSENAFQLGKDTFNI